MRGRRWRVAMIGLDTNVVIRWVTGDDEAQSKLAEVAIQSSQDSILINAVVLAEVSWVLTSVYGYPRQRIAGVLLGLVRHPAIVVDHAEAVEDALTAYETGGPGLSDHLIGALNKAAGCRTTLTFDRRAGRGPHFTAIA